MKHGHYLIENKIILTQLTTSESVSAQLWCIIGEQP